MKESRLIRGNYICFLCILMMLFSFVACEDTDTDTPDNLEDTTTVDNGLGILENENRRTIEITAVNMRYEPAEITASPGEKLEIRLINNGDTKHNIEFELPSGEEEFDSNLAAGESGTLIITAPDSSGTYTFYCPVNNHHERGMEGRLVVR